MRERKKKEKESGKREREWQTTKVTRAKHTVVVLNIITGRRCTQWCKTSGRFKRRG